MCLFLPFGSQNTFCLPQTKSKKTKVMPVEQQKEEDKEETMEVETVDVKSKKKAKKGKFQYHCNNWSKITSKIVSN